MNDLLFAGFEYQRLNNLGDNIQSIAVERLLPPVKTRFNRDTLAQADPDFPVKIIMNGWFSHFPETCLPLSKRLHPVFWGFHITDWNNSWKYFSKKHIIEYLKKFQPIGCREPYTAMHLADLGIETFVTYCLTLTLPKREPLSLQGKIFAVDIPPHFLPEELRGEALFYSHILPGSGYRENQKRIYARELLNMYQRQAKLVVTTRLHCLLPCIAMGIPVIFFGDQNDYRTSWVRELGVKVYTEDDLDMIDWNPPPLSFDIQKDKMISDFRKII